MKPESISRTSRVRPEPVGVPGKETPKKEITAFPADKAIFFYNPLPHPEMFLSGYKISSQTQNLMRSDVFD